MWQNQQDTQLEQTKATSSHICSYVLFVGKFPFRTDLEEHKIIHTRAKLYKCEYCGNTFTDSSNWSKHKKTASKNGSKV